MGRLRGEMTLSKGPQVGLEPWAAAARKSPLYQLSYWAPCDVFLI